MSHYTDLQIQQRIQATNDAWYEFECREIPFSLVVAGKEVAEVIATHAEAERVNTQLAAWGVRAEYVEKKREVCNGLS